MDLKLMLRVAGKKRRVKRRVGKPIRPSKRAEANYRADLLDVVDACRQATVQYLLPVLKRTESQYARAVKDSLTVDGYAHDILAAFDAMTTALGGVNRMAYRIASLAVQRAKEDTEAQLSASIKMAAGIDMAMAIKAVNVQPQVDAAIVANVSLIESIPQQYLQQVKTLVLNDIQQGARYETLASDIEGRLGVTESRAKLIARDQTSKMNASINEAKQTALGITKYEWQTAEDERVRESHREHDGKVFRWDAPPGDTGHPGHDINCRCVAGPVIEFEEE